MNRATASSYKQAGIHGLGMRYDGGLAGLGERIAVNHLSGLAGLGDGGEWIDSSTFLDDDGTLYTLSNGIWSVWDESGSSAILPETPPSNAITIQDVKDMVTAGLSIKQAWDIHRINVDRVSRGQAPLSNTQIQALAPRLNVGMSQDTKDMLIYGGLGLAALAALFAFK